MGTPQYMSPEQIDGKGLITHKADLYAMAVIVFEMLAGTPPFQDDTPIKLLIKHLKDEAPLLRQVAPGVRVPEAVEAFLRKNLSKNPDERCGDALGFKAELLAAAGDMTQVPLAGTTLGWEPTIEALVVGTVNIAQPTKLASAAPDTNRTRVSATFAPGPRPKPTPRPPTQKPPTQPPAPRPATLPPRPAPGTEAPTIAGSLHVVAADETAPPLAKKPFPIAIVAAAAGVIAAGIAAWALLSRAPEVPRPAPEVAAPVAVVPVPPPVAAVPVPEPPAAPVVAPGPPATAPAIAPAPAVAPSPPAPGPAAVAAQPGPSPAPAVPKKKPAQAPRKKKNLGLE
jgi:serine/threonine-protein kinase